MNRLLRGALALVLVVAAAGCAATRQTGGERRDLSIITAEEISRTSARTAYEAVDRLRPFWVRSRGDRSARLPTAILVYLNGTRMGTTEALQRLDVHGITSIRYLDGPAAHAQLPGTGSMHVEGAILVSTSPLQ